jgi:signal transduction histidine kinase
MVDVSEIKRTELLVEQQNKQLQELNSAKDKFFSILSHDLRSPFQDLISLTELLAEGVGDISAEEISRLGSKMHSNAKGLLKLLSNLLDWTRMQQGITRYVPEEIKLSGVVSQNFKLIIQRGEQKGVNLINAVDVEQKVVADEEMLNGILRNLLSNAIKFSNKGGKVIVSSREIENNLIEISVSDTGIGMDRELKNKLFKIDERTGRKGTNGEVSTGLGLLLCKEFVERHSGKIWVESIQNVGSTFHFTLPKAVEVDQKQRG